MDLKTNDGTAFPEDYPRVTIADGFDVTSPVGISISGDASNERFPYSLHARVEAIGGRLGITEVTIRRLPGGPAVGSGQLAKAKLWTHVIGAAFITNSLVFLELSPGYVSESTPHEALMTHLRSIKQLESPRDDLRALARVYRLARLGHYDPTNLLAEEFSVNGSTIRRWLSAAVVAGELRQDERRK